MKAKAVDAHARQRWMLKLVAPLLLGGCLVCTSAAAITSPDTVDDVASLYEDALISFNKGEISTSVIHLKNLLQADSTYLAGHILLGRSYLEQGYASLAEKEFNVAAELGADRALIIEHLARAYSQQLKYELLLDEIYPGNYSADLNSKIQVLRGKAYFQIGKLDESELEFLDAGKTDPTNVEAKLGLTTLHLYRKQYDKALQIVNTAIDMDPNDASSWFTKGLVFHAQGNFDEGLSYFKKALELDPDHYHAKLAYAGVRIDQRDFEGAKTLLSELYKLAPENPQVAYMFAVAASNSGDEARSQSLMQEAKLQLDSLGDDVILSHGPTLLLAGLVHFDLQEDQKAITYLSNYIARFHYDVRARVVLANIYLNRNQNTKAVQVLEPALSFAGQNPQMLSLLGSAYMKRNEYFKASQMFDQAAKVQPGNVDLLTRGAANDLLRGQTAQGMERLKSAVRQSDNAGAAGFMLVSNLLQAQEYEQAEQVAVELLKKSPDNPQVMNLYGVVLAEKGEYKQAREQYRLTLKQYPEFLATRVNLAKLNLQEGQLDVAGQQFSKLYQEAPDNLTFLIELAKIEVKKQNLETAIVWLEKAQALDSGHVAAVSKLIDLYIKTDQIDPALVVAKKLVDSNPNDAEALYALGRSELAAGKAVVAQNTLTKASQYAGFQSLMLPRIADLQAAARDIDGAIYTYQKHLSSYEGDYDALANIIDLQIKRRLFDNAQDGIERLRKAGYPAAAERLLGDMENTKANPKAALAHYQKSYKQVPSTVLVIRIFRTQLLLGDQQAALQFVQNWVENNPDTPAVREILAEGLLAMGNTQQARTELETLLEQNWKTPSVLNNLAMIYLVAGDQRAETYAREAFAMAPDSAAVLDTLGWVLVKKGESSEGLKMLRDAFARSANDAEIRYHIAVALQQLGRSTEAKKELQQALKSKANFMGRNDAQQLFDELSVN